jgi:hypothetical protein
VGDLEPVVTDVRYGQATDAGELLAASIDITAKATGTDTVAVESSGIDLQASNFYTFVVIGSPGSTDQPLTIVPVAVATAAS